MPVEAVAAVSEHQFGCLRVLAFFADMVWRPQVDFEDSEHEALVSLGVEVVKLSGLPDVGIGGIEVVGGSPEHGIALEPAGAGEEIFVLVIGSTACSPARSEAVDPDSAERVVEHAGAVSAVAGHLRLGPVQTIGTG